MKKALAFITVILLLALTACGGSRTGTGETFPPEEALCEVQSTTPDGRKTTSYHSGDEDGPEVRSIEELADGTVVEVHYYTSGNMHIYIERSANGAYYENRFLDDGSTCIYAKHILEDGQECETSFDENGNVTSEITRQPDGSFYERHYSSDGDYEKTRGADGSSSETWYYPSGNISKTINAQANGDWYETHYLDDGYVDENGALCSGTVCYSKTILANGEESELICDENGINQMTWVRRADGSYSEYRYKDGKLSSAKDENADGSGSEMVYDENGKLILLKTKGIDGSTSETTFYENGNFKSSVFDDPAGGRAEQEYYENGIEKRTLIQNATYTEEMHFDEAGYCTYRYFNGEYTEECIADETGKLVKYIFNGQVTEDAATLAQKAQAYNFRQ